MVARWRAYRDLIIFDRRCIRVYWLPHDAIKRRAWGAGNHRLFTEPLKFNRLACSLDRGEFQG